MYSADKEKGAFSTTAVNVELQEFITDDDHVISYDDRYEYEHVMPGEELPLTMKVNNLGIDCYVRFKVSFVDFSGNDISENVEGIANYWQKLGEYYYYKNVFKTNENLVIFDKIRIPSDLPKVAEDQKLILKVVVDAVQERNCTQDLSKPDPWNGAQIEQCIDDTFSLDNHQDENNLVVKYEDETDKYITIEDEFINRLDKLLPGDVIEGRVSINNRTKDKSEFFFSVYPLEELTEEQKDLLKNVKFTITNSKGEIIHNGTLLDINDMSLGKFKPNENEDLIFKIEIPKELGNKYSILNPGLVFKFHAKYEKYRYIGPPKTGDTKFSLSLILFFISAAGLITMLCLIRMNRRNDENINKS